MSLLITSLQNPRVKYLVHLRERRFRDTEQMFLVEGYRELNKALENGYPLQEVYYSPAWFQGSNEPALLSACEKAGARLIETAEHIFRKLAYRDRPEGLLALAAQQHKTLESLEALPAAPLLLVAETIEKPGNLGTILRSTDAVGADALILCDKRTDLFNPNVVRASIGTLFSVLLAEADADTAVAWLRRHGIRLLAATPHAEAVYTDTDMRGALAIIVGSEQYGISDKLLAEADLQVRIPMLGQADSLNVATATTLLLYEARRQRGWQLTGDNLAR